MRKNTSITLEKEVHEKGRLVAQRYGLTFSAFISLLIAHHTENNEKLQSILGGADVNKISENIHKNALG
ncbi:MAG TPA: hypothetical protein VJL87_03465 [Bdellovibrionota bacterium]|nr:hypothetical protein [Bdellovibrionota bacterium]